MTPERIWGRTSRERHADWERLVDAGAKAMGLTAFVCGPDPGHVCDSEGPEVAIETDGAHGSSASCSVCGMSAFERSFWEGP